MVDGWIQGSDEYYYLDSQLLAIRSYRQGWRSKLGKKEKRENGKGKRKKGPSVRQLTRMAAAWEEGQGRIHPHRYTYIRMYVK